MSGKSKPKFGAQPLQGGGKRTPRTTASPSEGQERFAGKPHFSFRFADSAYAGAWA